MIKSRLENVFGEKFDEATVQYSQQDLVIEKKKDDDM